MLVKYQGGCRKIVTYPQRYDQLRNIHKIAQGIRFPQLGCEILLRDELYYGLYEFVILKRRVEL